MSNVTKVAVVVPPMTVERLSPEQRTLYNAMPTQALKDLFLSQAKRAKKETENGLAVSEKGALSMYGYGRFPITLYKETWLTLLGERADDIRSFIAAHNAELKSKPVKE